MTPRRTYNVEFSATRDPSEPPWVDQIDANTTTEPQQQANDHRAEPAWLVAQKIRDFLRSEILCLESGRFRSPSIVRNRLVVLTVLLDPSVSRSFAHEARELGCTKAQLSKTAKLFTRKLGLRPLLTNGGRKSANVIVRERA